MMWIALMDRYGPLRHICLLIMPHIHHITIRTPLWCHPNLVHQNFRRLPTRHYPTRFNRIQVSLLAWGILGSRGLHHNRQCQQAPLIFPAAIMHHRWTLFKATHTPMRVNMRLGALGNEVINAREVAGDLTIPPSTISFPSIFAILTSFLLAYFWCSYLDFFRFTVCELHTFTQAIETSIPPITHHLNFVSLVDSNCTCS